MVAIAKVSGTTNTSSKASIMKVTASARLPHMRRCTRCIRGQVATTIIVAQISGARKGRMIQNEAKIRPPMNNTAKVVRVSSLRDAFMGLSGGWLMALQS